MNTKSFDDLSIKDFVTSNRVMHVVLPVHVFEVNF